GRCSECGGFGRVIVPDPNKLIDFNKSLRDYAVQFKPLSPAGWQGRWMMSGGLFDPDLPIKDTLKRNVTCWLSVLQKAKKSMHRFILKTVPKTMSGTDYCQGSSVFISTEISQSSKTYPKMMS